MQKPARRHHYLPASYLAGFTSGGRKEDFLYVFDLELPDPKPRRQRPRNVAFESDYHRIDWPGIPLDSFERILSSFEGAVKSAIADVVDRKDIDGETLDLLLQFAAFTDLRAPRMRRANVELTEQRTGLPLEDALTVPETWNSILQWCARAGTGLDRDELLGMLGDPSLRRGCTQYWHFLNNGMYADTMLQQLRDRRWEVWFALEKAPDFVCSDSPVCVQHVPPVQPYQAPQLSDHGTMVTFPLHRRAALVGRFDGDHGLAWVGPQAVAWVNFATIWAGLGSQNAFLYSSSKDFAWLGERGVIKDAAACFAFWESARRKQATSPGIVENTA